MSFEILGYALNLTVLIFEMLGFEVVLNPTEL